MVIKILSSLCPLQFILHVYMVMKIFVPIDHVEQDVSRKSVTSSLKQAEFVQKQIRG